MWIDDFSLEDSQGGESSPEQSKEQQEKQRARAKKGLAGIGKTRKDESKAIRNNDILFDILVKIIRQKEFDEIIALIMPLLEIGVPSSFFLWGMSLINRDSLIFIRQSKYPGVPVNEEIMEPFWEKTYFSDSLLPESYKKRVNHWVEDYLDFIVFDPSYIQFQKISRFIEHPDIVKKMREFIQGVLQFFFVKQNVIMDNHTALTYADYILTELKGKIQNFKKNLPPEALELL